MISSLPVSTHNKSTNNQPVVYRMPRADRSSEKSIRFETLTGTMANPRRLPGSLLTTIVLVLMMLSSSEGFVPLVSTRRVLASMHSVLSMSTPTIEEKTDVVEGKNDTQPTESSSMKERLEDTTTKQGDTYEEAAPKTLKIKYDDLDGEAKVEEPGDRDKIMTLIKQYEFEIWDSEPQLPIETIVQRTLDTVEDAFLHLRRVPYDKGWFPEPQMENRPTVVVLGSGWAAHALLKVADTYKMRIIVVSPSNHFVFTPMLASASVGTVEYRSMTEAVRAANPMIENYIEGMATDVDLEKQTLKVKLNNLFEGIKEGRAPEIEIKYDKLVVGEYAVV